MIGDAPIKLKMERAVQTRCGVACYPLQRDVDAGLYDLNNLTGGTLRGTTLKKQVTCQKCVNLITVGTIHANKE